MWEYRAEMRRVVDGDTVDFLVDLGFTVHVTVRARLYGIDTPEVYGVKHSSDEYAEGKLASEFTRLWFVDNCPNDVCVIRTQKTGKYGRWIATVLPEDGEGQSLNDALVENGHAKAVDY
jgi:micrococcal nuclease